MLMTTTIIYYIYKMSQCRSGLGESYKIIGKQMTRTGKVGEKYRNYILKTRESRLRISVHCTYTFL